ncbi:MAG: prepilin-type N-terminal cleavage/methylation domain-containing protein [Proteobacteria bacterium]|nr:prepilin-type N-terminal cleavage/methylation domain-containing protein [Pseudomonadota bacterium]
MLPMIVEGAMADRQEGFSLIETLVALALLGLVSGTVYSSYTASMLGSEESAQTALATRFAKSKLDEISVIGVLDESRHQGTTGDGFRWRVEVTPIKDQETSVAQAGRQPRGQPRGQRAAALVTVTVSWQGRNADRSVELTTVRLIAAQTSGEREG